LHLLYNLNKLVLVNYDTLDMYIIVAIKDIYEINSGSKYIGVYSINTFVVFKFIDLKLASIYVENFDLIQFGTRNSDVKILIGWIRI